VRQATLRDSMALFTSDLTRGKLLERANKSGCFQASIALCPWTIRGTGDTRVPQCSPGLGLANTARSTVAIGPSSSGWAVASVRGP
jgi:hypothetical protein